jgi:DNA-binding LacI/PurR family transcriptional regulator
MRLRSESDLGRLFGESRQKIRRALDVLVAGGYLTRQHGCGTFVRKVFCQEEAPLLAFVRNYSDVMPERLFQTEVVSTRLKPNRKKHQLRIGLSGDPVLLNRTNDVLYQGAKTRVEELGHKPVVYSHMTYNTAELKNPRDFAEELKRTRCDGYLIESRWAESVKAAFEDAFGPDGHPFATYFWPASIRVSHEPLVQLDTNEAMERALRILAETGRRKIAVVIMDCLGRDIDSELRIYRNTLSEYGISYHKTAHIRGSYDTDVLTCLNQTFTEDMPDAIYVADDHYLGALSHWLDDRTLKPGADIGIITLSNKGCSLPNAHNWSRLEFDPRLVGRLAVDNMIDAIESPDRSVGSFSLQAAWLAGDTH